MYPSCIEHVLYDLKRVCVWQQMSHVGGTYIIMSLRKKMETKEQKLGSWNEISKMYIQLKKYMSQNSRKKKHAEMCS